MVYSKYSNLLIYLDHAQASQWIQRPSQEHKTEQFPHPNPNTTVHHIETTHKNISLFNLD